jgi:GH18 family chitinase
LHPDALGTLNVHPDADPENCNNCNTTACQSPARNNDPAQYAKFLTEVKAALAVAQKARGRKDEYIISMAGPGGQDKVRRCY